MHCLKTRSWKSTYGRVGALGNATHTTTSASTDIDMFWPDEGETCFSVSPKVVGVNMELTHKFGWGGCFGRFFLIENWMKGWKQKGDQSCGMKTEEEEK